jgi:RNA polymerase sigma factor (sigma-70 family)
MNPRLGDPEGLLAEQGFVRNLAKSLVFDDALAEDVAQQTWLAALQHAPRNPRSPRAWLAVLVRNFASKALRGEQRRAAREAEAAKPEAIPSTAEILEREAARRSVVEAVLELDEPYRSALILRYFEELPPRAIAERLGVPAATVQTRLKRGLEILRARLDGRYGRRATWAVVLVGATKLDLPPAASLAFVAKSFLPAGVLLMTGKKLVLISTALVLLAALAVWQFEFAPTRAIEPGPSEAASQAAPIVPVEPAKAALETAATASDERTPIAAPVAVEAPQPPAGNEGSLRLSVTWSDKTVAAGVGVTLFAWRAPDPYHSALRATTDAAGSILFRRVAAGPATIDFDRSKRTNSSATIVGGEETTKFVELPRGIDVQGSVVDTAGRGVADADVFLTSFGYAENYEGFVVARSGADGSFFVRDVEPMTCLSARAPMRTPTVEHSVGGATDRAIAMTLAFEAPGGELTGRVLDPDSHPVAFAKVLVGDDHRFDQFTLPDGSLGLKPPAQLAITDERGEFRMQGVELGTWPLRVRAKGYAPVELEVTIEPARATRRDIDLTPACVLRGSVRDASGAPVKGAQLKALPQGFASPLAVTTADGSFVLENLPAAEFRVEVQADQRGRAERTFLGGAGVELRAEFVLSTGSVLRGRVHAPGQKLAGWIIEARSMPGQAMYLDSSTTDSEGRFTFSNCPDAPLRLDARTHGIHPVARLENVRAGPEEVVIEPDPTLLPSIRIRGRVLDESMRAVAASVMPSNPRFDFGSREDVDAETGRFELGPFAPGEWSLNVSAPDFPNMRVGPQHVDPDGIWDVGDVTLARGGTLIVHLTREGGGELSPPQILLRSANGPTQRMSVSGDRATSPPLAAGRCLVHVYGDESNAPQIAHCEIRAGETSELEVVLHNGQPVSFEIRGATGAHPLALQIQQPDGTYLQSLWLEKPSSPATWSARLLPGHYLFAANAGEMRAKGDFDVAASGAAQQVVIELH